MGRERAAAVATAFMAFERYRRAGGGEEWGTEEERKEGEIL